MGGAAAEGNCENHHQLLHLLLMSEDVLIQILLWLPVISLLRFKSVCKSWRSIIESPFFIHLHATTLQPKLGGSSLLFRGYQTFFSQEEKGIIFFTLSGKEFEVFEILGRPPLVDLGEELNYLEMFVSFNMMGCYNGLVCLHDYFSRNVALWNPAIKQTRILPKPSNLLGYYKFCDKIILDQNDGYSSEDFVRFGIDVKTNDYKVLLITTYKPRSEDYDNDLDKRCKRSDYTHARRVHVYSLSTDSWRCIEDAVLSAAHRDCDVEIEKHSNQGLHINGRYFFTATYYKEVYNWSVNDMPLLLSFDFTQEIFTTIQPPPLNLTKKRISCSVYFIPFGGKVALVDGTQQEDYRRSSDYDFDIWVLNEKHGLKESWTKLYTLGPRPCFPRRIVNNGGEFLIMGPLRHGDVDPVDKLQLLNLITEEIKDLHGDCDTWAYNGIYKPSLVQIGGRGATNDKCM